MTIRKKMTLILVLTFFTYTTPSAWSHVHDSSEPSFDSSRLLKLGELDFPTSAHSPEAKRLFNQGIAALHDFLYSDAMAIFKEARRIEPKFFMAYVAEALTHTYLLWGAEDIKGGREVLNQLAPTPVQRAKLAPTQRERLYLAAVEKLYAPVPRSLRLLALAETMRTLSEQYPSDMEAKAFYALSLLAIINPEEFGYSERAQGRLDIAVRKLKEVLEVNPRHPGALHSIIHAYDSPSLAYLAKPYLLPLKTCAPDASHMVHMPTHILLRLGDWKTSIAWNTESYNQVSKGSDFHTLSYLHYNYLQTGKSMKKEADQALNAFKTHCEQSNPLQNSSPCFAYQEVKSRQAIEWDEWDLADPALPAILPYQGNITWAYGVQASQIYVIGIAALLKSDEQKLQGALGLLEDLRSRAAELSKNSRLSGDNEEALRTDKSVVLTEVIIHQLLANWEFRTGHLETMQNELAAAVRLEDSLGPPTATLPFPMISSHQLSAELLYMTKKGSKDIALIRENLRSVEALQPNKIRTRLWTARVSEP